MSPMQRKLTLLLSIVVFILVPMPTVFAASAVTAEPGVAFKVTYTQHRYTVFMRSDVTPANRALTLTAQVTLKAPHGVEADRFTVDDLQNTVDGTTWTVTSRIDAPREDPNADYVSFTVDFPGGNHQAYHWQAGEEIQVFSFTNTGTCLGTVALLENSDPFMMPANSANTNPGNQIDVIGIREGNLYTGTYGGAANCDAVTPVSAPPNLFLPLITR